MRTNVPGVEGGRRDRQRRAAAAPDQRPQRGLVVLRLHRTRPGHRRREARRVGPGPRPGQPLAPQPPPQERVVVELVRPVVRRLVRRVVGRLGDGSCTARR